MKKTLIQIGVVIALVVIPYSISGAPKDKKITDAQKIENLIETVQKLAGIQNEQQSYIQVLWARTQELHEQVLKLQGDPTLDKAVYRVQAELNDVDARVSQLERPEVEDEAK